MEHQSLEGRTAIVTGAGRGIGEGIATALHTSGARVVVTDRRTTLGKKVAKRLGAGASFLELDVTDEAQWKEVVAGVARDFGSIDILVNNAGVAGQSPIDRLSVEEWDRIVSVNLTGTFLGCRAVTPAMKKHGRGSIVNVSSVDGARGREGLHAYTASKFGIRGLTQSLAVELGPAGIRVNTVLPGLVPTSMTARVDPDSFAIPLERSGTVEEIGAAVQFLASDAASYVNGAEIAVDGGLISGVPRRE